MRRKLQRSHRSLDTELVLEMRDAGLSIGRPDRRVDKMLHTGLARQRGEAFTLFLFALDTGLPRVLHGKDAPRAGERLLERGGIVQIALDDLRTGAGEGLRRIASGFARHGADVEAFAGEGADDGAALVTRGSGDEDCALIGHAGSSARSAYVMPGMMPQAPRLYSAYSGYRASNSFSSTRTLKRKKMIVMADTVPMNAVGFRRNRPATRIRIAV